MGIFCMRNLILHPTSSPAPNLSKSIGKHVENMNKNVVFFYDNMSIQPLWLTHFIEILLVLEFQLKKIILARFLIRPILDPKFPLMQNSEVQILNATTRIHPELLSEMQLAN